MIFYTEEEWKHWLRNEDLKRYMTEIIGDWKPSDVPALPLFKLTQSELNHLNESENPDDDIDISIGSVFRLKAGLKVEGS